MWLGVTAAGDSLVRARKVVHPDRLAHQPVVAGDVQRDQRLDPRVAGILQLFVMRGSRNRSRGRRVGRCASPFPRFSPMQDRPIRKEPHFERIARVDAVQIFDDERRRSGFDVELDITIGFEPRGGTTVRRLRRAGTRPRIRGTRGRRFRCGFLCPVRRTALPE